jgi:hypothetical protein
MQTTLQKPVTINYAPAIADSSLISRFSNWCAAQEPNRLGWLGAIIAIHGCVLTPVTLFFIVLAGTNITFFVAALVAMGMSLVTNLAAMPTKITLPAFFISVLIDVAVIGLCIATGLGIEKAVF